jgi:threonine dehydratase
VKEARNLLREIVPVSRMVEASSLSETAGARVFLKLEAEGPTGSFKVRGAYHAIRKRMQLGPIPGVVTSSTGNHGAATAFAAKQLGLPSRIYLPENPNPAKRARIAQQGAEIVEVGEYLELSREHAERFAKESGWFDLVDGTEAEMLPGTATIGSEILEQAPEVDAILVPVGDSTLLRGLAFAAKTLKPEVKIIGVQAERAPAYALAFEKGHGISTDSSDTIADGLAAREAPEENVRQIKKLADEFLLVSEEEMLAAIRHLHECEGILAEPAGAATTAALLKTGKAHAGKAIVLLVSGANISEEILRRALQPLENNSATL